MLCMPLTMAARHAIARWLPRAKVMLVRYALEAPANIADMPINAAMGILMPASGKMYLTNIPIIAPAAPPMVNNGASVPPDVPLPNAMAHERNFKNTG